jgi:hypothetical protein
VSDRGGRRRSGALRSFVVGGMVGAAAAVVAPRLRRGHPPTGATRPVSGLEAFEGAPCWEHDAARPTPGGGGD